MPRLCVAQPAVCPGAEAPVGALLAPPCALSLLIMMSQGCGHRLALPAGLPGPAHLSPPHSQKCPGQGGSVVGDWWDCQCVCSEGCLALPRSPTLHPKHILAVIIGLLIMSGSAAPAAPAQFTPPPCGRETGQQAYALLPLCHPLTQVGPTLGISTLPQLRCVLAHCDLTQPCA